HRAKRGDLAVPYAHALLATFLLTGGRQKEVLGLEVEDVSFDRKTITFRPNQWRRLKTATSHRSVPLWPQLEESLREYVFGAAAPPGRLLFPSFRTGQEAMLTDFRKHLDAVAERAGWKPGEIRSKMFRHTYCAARLQTLDRGAPVSEFTVARELGHGGEAMVRRVYGHLGQVRQRIDVVEYRVEPYAAILGDRLAALRVGAGQT
ncbi:MAG: tyrosine-type recombinase/integrase, partial [Tepidiformaceae bacterium]